MAHTLNKHNVPFLLLAILHFSLCCGLKPGHAQEDLKPMFDGKTLDGWVQRGGKAKYVVEDETIVGTSIPDTPNSFLCTDREYTNFVMELEYKVHPELNSGIQIRSNSLPDYKKGRVHGYQVEIDPSLRGFSSGIYDEARRGWLFDLKQNTAARYAFKQNDWNHVRVIAKDNRFVTYMNGVLAANLTDDETSSGFIALQVHAVGKREDPLDVRWRNVRLSENVDGIELPPVDAAVAKQHSGGIVADNAEVKTCCSGFKFTEGAALGPDGRIYFSDIPNSNVHAYDPESEKLETYREESGASNGLYWAPNDALISCEGGNRTVTRHFIGGDYEKLVGKFNGKQLNSPNDVELDNIGGFYFTDPRYGDRENMEMEVEGVYYVDRKQKLTRVIDDLVRPNGLIMSPDFSILYVADAGANKTYRYDVKGPGDIANKTEFAPIGSDGMTNDDFGNIYFTHGQYVHVYSPTGEEIEKIEFPEKPANVTFGGKDRNVLFVTARTSLYSVPTLVTGGKARMNPR